MKWANATPLCFFLLLLPFPNLNAQDGEKLDLALNVTSFHIVRVAEDRIEAEVDLTTNAHVDATVDTIDFGAIHINGAPFFAKEVSGPINLQKDQAVALPPISVIVYFADLDSLQPLIDLLDQQKAHLTGEVSLTVHPNVVERLILRRSHPLVVLPVDQTLDVQTPLGELGRRAGIAALKAAQFGLGGGRSLEQTFNRSGAEWNKTLTTARNSLLHGQNCYTVMKKKIAATTCLDQLAFLVSPQLAISSAELGTPWKFDPAIARALAHDGAHLEKTQSPIHVQRDLATAEPNSSPSSHAPQEAGFQQLGEAPSIKKIILPGYSETAVLERDAPGVYGHLKLPNNEDGTVMPMASPEIRNQAGWNQLAIFRLVHARDGSWKVATTFLSGTASNGRVIFNRPVDPSAIGSPILTPAGVLGVVQCERGGTLLSREMQP